MKTKLRKRRIGLRIFLCLLGILLIGAGISLGRMAMHRQSPDTFGSCVWEQDAPFDLSLFDGTKLTLPAGQETLRLLYLSDPQLKFGWFTSDTKTMDLICRAIAEEKPDLVVIPGDLTRSFLFTYDAYRYFADFMEEQECYWTMVFGNHDAQHDSSKYTLSELLKSYEHCLFDVGPENIKGTGNFLVNVFREGEATPCYALVMMDSNMYPEDYAVAESWVYDWIGEDQIAWYRWAVNGLKALNPDIRTTLVQHIPLRQWADMYYADLSAKGETIPVEIDKTAFLPVSGVAGTVCEADKSDLERMDAGYDVGIYYQGRDTGLFSAVRELGVTDAMVCSHDHVNTLRGTYGGVYLIYTHCTGYHTYPFFPHANWLTGLVGGNEKPLWNGEMWVDEAGNQMEKGVSVMDIDLTEHTFTFFDLADSELS